MNTLQCWLAYLASESYDPAMVMELTGALKGALRGWKTGRLPIGEYLLRLRVFLKYVGYQVRELEEIGDLYPVAEALVVYQLEVGDLASAVGLSDDSVMRVLLNKRGTSPAVRQAMKDWVKAKQGEAHIFSNRWTSLVQGVGLAVGVEETETSEEKDQFIKSAVAALWGLECYTTRLETDEFSSKERQQFRDLARGDVMKVANQLFRLCSETARKEMKEGEG